MAKGNYIKIIFGLKLKQLRIDKNMSLSYLAVKSNLSVSYLNEIETGKKYPKADKIATLAGALGVNYDDLVSLKLFRNLAPIGDLLESNILEQLPLDHYGIEINKLITIMSGASMQLSALIATFIEMAKSSEMSQNNFSRTALRTFKEFNDNYFEELESAAKEFLEENHLDGLNFIESGRLSSILEKKYNYAVDEETTNNFPELDELRAAVVKGKKNKLFLNRRLSDAQKAFVIGKELAYNFLSIKDRSYIYSSIKLNTFDQLLNYFKASYFSTALLINSMFFVRDLELFFNLPEWNGNTLLELMSRYNCTTEMFFQRLTNLSSKHLGLNKFFFLRFNYENGSNRFDLSKELRLNTRRNPGGYQTDEHYCRRWLSIDTLKKLEAELKKDNHFEKKITGILHSKFFGSEDEYLSISVAQKGRLLENNISSLTIGFQIDDALKGRIKFWNDPAIEFKTVNDTCEKCKIADCADRVAQQVSAERAGKMEALETAIKKLEELE